jgi:hypothetical protein
MNTRTTLMSSDYNYRPRQTASDRNDYTAEQAAVLISQHLATRQPKKFDGRCPFVGPVPFTADDARIYFGREDALEELLDRIEHDRLIVLAGPENAGKTSLLQAGLIFALRNGALMDSDKWLIHTFTPGANPVQKLAEASATLGERAGLAQVMTDAIRKRGLTGPNALNDLVEMLLGPDKTRRAVLIIDQFEEVFTKCKSPADAQAFTTFLTQAAQQAGSRAIIFISLRGEFLQNAGGIAELKPWLDKRIALRAMENDELARSVVLPALECGVRIEPQLVARLVNDVQGDPGMLPKLQLAMRDLFMALPAKAGKDKTLTLADYIDFGPIRPRDDDHAPPVVAGATGAAPLKQTVGEARAVSHFAEQEKQMRRMKLVTTLAGVLAAIALALGVWGFFSAAQSSQRADAAATAQALALATATQAAGSAGAADVARSTAEAIAAAANIDRDSAIATRSAAEAAATQAVEEQQVALAQKATAEAVATQGVVEVNRGVSLQATVQAQATAAAALVKEAEATRAAANEIRATQEVDLKASRSRELAAIASSQISSDPQLALLLAMEADRTQRTRQSEGVLRRAYAAAFPDDGVIRIGSPVNDVQFNADGTQLLVANRDGFARLIDIASGQVLTTYRGNLANVTSAGFSPDGRWVITTGADRTARLFDVASGRALTVMVGHTGTVTSAGFSPDGKLLVTGSADRTARVWDVSAGKAITTPMGFTQPISVAIFAKDNEVWLRDAIGEWIARGARDGSALPAPTMDTLTLAEVNSGNTASVRVASQGASFETPALSAAINKAAFDSSESRVALAVADGTVRLYPVNVFDVITAAEGKLERQLTCEERVQFLNESTDCAAIPTPTPEK